MAVVAQWYEFQFSASIHEARNEAMKYRVIVVAALAQSEEIPRRARRKIAMYF